MLREIENASDSEDASVLAEKESQPSEEDSIDTIEEEVDLSASEGSDTTPYPGTGGGNKDSTLQQH